MPSTTRPYAPVAAACFGLGVLLAGCEAPWSAPQGPDTAGGARLDDAGQFEFWLGAECDAVGEVRVELTEADDGAVLDTWLLRSEEPDGTPLQELTLGVPPDGFREANALEVDWRDAELVRISVHPADTDTTSGDGGGRFYPDVPARAYVSTERFLDDAGDRRDQWYLQDRGWYTETEYRELAGDDDMVYPYCDVPDQDVPTSGT